MAIITLYPSVVAEDDLRDVVSRLVWHFAPYEKYISEINLVTRATRAEIAGLAAPPYLDESAGPARLAGPFGERVRLDAEDGPPAWTDRLGRSDYVYLWRMPDAANGPFASLAALKQAAPGAEIVVADRHARPSEASLLLRAGLAIAGSAEALVAANREKFERFRAATLARTAHVLGTGPSLEQIGAFDLSDGDVIACNSIVVNRELFAALRPRAVCAADPIFHAGPSAYARDFRNELRQRMDELDFTLFVPLRDYLLHLSHIPERHHHRVIGVPFNAGSLNLDLAADFSVYPAPNVLTLLMLPLAATLYGTITVSGCDGRPLAANTYFWGHHKKSQLNERMDDIKIAHPGFFDISYDDYYADHCRLVERIAELAEAGGRTVRALSASYIPALRRRGAAEPLPDPLYAAPSAPLTVLSLNPDLVDRSGHYFNYEAKLGPAVMALGCHYRVAAGTRFAAGGRGPVVVDGIAFDPVLAINSWTLGNASGPRDDRFHAIEAAVREEFAAVIERAAAEAPGELLVYMYTGSLEHLALLRQITLDRPNVRVVVNLFWLKAADVWAADFTARFGPVLADLKAGHTLAATAMTTHQQVALARRCGLALDVARHPSPVFSDERVMATLARRPGDGDPDRPFQVFLPSANRVEKGSRILAEIGIALAELFTGEALRLVFRTDPLEGRSPEERARLAPLLGDHAVLDGFIEEEALVEILAASDVIVLPYMPPDFADRTSGLTVDALYAFRPVVVSGGTWLAEFVERYGSGQVVDPPSAGAFALAAYRLAHAVRLKEVDLRAGAQRYFSTHSWAALAAQTLAAATVRSDHVWNAREAVEAEALRPAALPLLTAPEGAAADIDYLALFEALGLVGADDRVVLSGPRNLATLSAGRSGDVVVSDPHVYAALARQPGGPRLHDARALGTAPGLQHGTLALVTSGLLDRSGAETPVAVIERYDELMAPALWRRLDRAPLAALVLGLNEAEFGAPGRAAARLAASLAARGYRTVVVERRGGEAADMPPLRRAVLGPYVPPFPKAPCDVVALPASLSAEALKAAFAAAAQGVAYVEARTPEQHGAEILADAPPLEAATTLALARQPGPSWGLLALKREREDGEGFAILCEVGERRLVHRAPLMFEATDTAPLTVSVEVKALTARFVTLWITDLGNSVLLNASFDLGEGKVAALTAEAAVAPQKPAAFLAPLEGVAGAHRIWVSLPRWARAGVFLAQVVTRESGFASPHFVGSPERRLGVRNLLVEAAARPSRIDPAVPEAAAPPPVPAPAPVAPAATPVAPAAPAAPAMPAAMAPVMAPPEPIAAAGAIDLLARGVSEDPFAGWKAAASAEVDPRPDGIRFNRNGGAYSGQFLTRLPVRPGVAYRLELDLPEINPAAHVVVDGTVVARVQQAGRIAVDVRANGPHMQLELRAVDSHFATFVLAEGRLSVTA